MTQLQVSGEGKLYQDLFRNGVRCFSLFTIGNVTSSEERRTVGVTLVDSARVRVCCVDQRLVEDSCVFGFATLNTQELP